MHDGNVNRSHTGNQQTRGRFRYFCSSRDGSGDSSDSPKTPATGGDEFDEMEDEFTSMLALDPEEAARAAAAATPEEAVDSLSSAPHDMTPEAAAALVERMVSAASKATSSETAALGAPQPFSRHSLRVLCVSRVITNSVHAASKERFPIEEKVCVAVDLGRLSLGRLARAALEEIAGQRVSGDTLRVTVRKYASKEENLAHAFGLAGRVIAEAQKAVGEEVDEAPLEEWGDILTCVRDLTAEEPVKFRNLVEHVAEVGGTSSSSGGGDDSNLNGNENGPDVKLASANNNN